MGKLSNSMWRLLGSQATKNQNKSINLISQAEDFAEWAAEIDDADIPDTAQELDLSSTGSEDIPRFLALVREAADRSVNLRPFDVQLQGALRLLVGDIVEMSTGEGKTLAGALAAVGYALQGHTVHIISVNDYLATRDAEWMRPLFEIFKMTVGSISESSTPDERRVAYNCDITYGSVNEIGFDILRDQLVTRLDDLISPTPDVVIIDEADSVLVDEALVPLILAGSTDGTIPDQPIHAAVAKLGRKHYEVDAEGRNVFLTELGEKFIEEELGGIDLFSPAHVGSTLVHVNIALHAQILLERDVHYIVRDGGVHLINSSRGRIAQLQRWPDGLQAAVELKEGLTQTDSGEVIDTITVQALIGRYPTVCGMTGTAIAAGEQFRQFYDLGISQIAPNMPNIREDEEDRVFDNKVNKVEALIEFVQEIHETGQPVLIGTHDVAESEELAHMLERVGIKSSVLNAKNDADEAAIIAEAGALNAVTVSTQMAGRGTDIKLGGSGAVSSETTDGTTAEHDEVVSLGGLCVVGTGRYDTERLDSQLRGRAGRQGDPGRSVFFSSLDDPLVTKNLTFKKDPESDADDGDMGAKGADLIEQAQRIAQGQMLEIHSNTWRYNKLVNQQREIIIERRKEILATDKALDELGDLEPERLAELEDISAETLSQAAREIVLYHLDRGWADHLAYVADVRASIHLRALGRQSPLDEFHKLIVEAFTALSDEAMEAARETFIETEITDAGLDLSQNNLRRSTTTWTYMVHDNPFDGGKGIDGIAGVFR